MKSKALILLAVFNGFATSGTFASTALSVLDDQLVRAEQQALNCLYPHVRNKYLINEFSSNELAKYFGLGKEFREECPTILRSYNAKLKNLTNAQVNYPTYGEVLKKLNTKIQGVKYKDHLVTLPFQSTLEVKSINPSKIDPKEIEKSLRLDLSGIKQPECDSELMAAKLADSHKKYDSLAWKGLLHHQGYDCVAKTYDEMSQDLNDQNNLGFAQDAFADKLEKLKNPSELSYNFFKNKLNQVLTKDHMIILFPNLGYDIPSDLPREKLTMTEWKKKNFYSPSIKQRFQDGYQEEKKHVEPYGIRFETIERVTVESAEAQIADSEKKFIGVLHRELAKNPKTKFIIMGRSMGALVAREILQRNETTKINNKTLPELIETVIFMGGTPYGSVIADYKTRFDSHDENFQQLTSLKASIARLFLDLKSFFTGVESHFERLIEAGRVRDNIKTMSFRNFNSKKIELGTKSPYKVVNLIYLRPKIKGYFANSKLSEYTDPVFLHWTMYGPTEGSSPLSHAAWDTSKSVRIFLKSHNHLAGWNLTAEENINLLVKTLELSHEIGFITSPQ
jgi:hypothetical protein